MSTIHQLIESELQRLISQNMLSCGKKIMPEVAKRLSEAVESHTVEHASTVSTDQITYPAAIEAEQSKQTEFTASSLPVFQKIKELYGGLYSWQITDEMYLDVEKRFVE